MATGQDSKSRGLDVYAKSFIQNALHEINDASATVVTSMPARWIDFVAYTRTFAGSDFITQERRTRTAQFDESLDYAWEGDLCEGMTGRGKDCVNTLPASASALGPTDYLTYYGTALAQEATSQHQECKDHELFQVPLHFQGASLDLQPFVYLLRVPGLREMSLRIDVGDVVRLRQLRFDQYGKLVYGASAINPWGRPVPLELQKETEHHAVVWAIDRRNETLRLRIDYLIPNSMIFNVKFTVQSYRLAEMHQAVSTINSGLTAGHPANTWMRSMLFPTHQDGRLQKTLNRWETKLDFNDDILNFEQKKAVATIILDDYGVVPYIISGPPGTGKTKTMVELALQLLSQHRSAHILVCAPSDPASDTLVQRLGRYMKPGELLRLNSPGRSFPEVPDAVLPYCFIGDDLFSLPSFAALMRTKIVVTACRDAELLVKARVTNRDLVHLQQQLHTQIHPESVQAEVTQLHWTGLLIDEAAQATEPEALIALSVVAPPEWLSLQKLLTPIFVLAGDQHQLGPRSASKERSMRSSLLERLLALPFYSDHPLARSQQDGGVMRPLTQDMLPICRPTFANLIRNYRSHPSILAIPSQMFYHDTLEPEAHDSESLSSWPGWKGRGWPVLFAVNTASDEIEPDDGGSFNVTEAQMACHCARNFLESNAVRTEDICIISPYRAQVLLLRKVARSQPFSMFGVNIGPLEAFQGLESRVVILCTTRTRSRFVEHDLVRGLGVIHEPKRFNVALTRARQALIVIGNPAVLDPDECWREFMGFCWRNGMWDDPKESSTWEPIERLRLPTSRLEKQLLHRDESQITNDVLWDGTRRFGASRDANHALWQSGVEAEHRVSTHEANYGEG